MSHVSATTYEGLNRALAALAGVITSARYGDGNGGIIPVDAMPELLVEVETFMATIENLKTPRIYRERRARPPWDALAGQQEDDLEEPPNRVYPLGHPDRVEPYTEQEAYDHEHPPLRDDPMATER
jgi:hypothetical protein